MSRASILEAVRRNQPRAVPLPAVPAFASDGDDALLKRFTAALARMGGNVVAPLAGMPLDVFVLGCFPRAQVICSATTEVQGTFDLRNVRHPGELNVVDVGIVRAAFGVAETGSVWLSEREFGVNALGFLSQHLVVLLDPAAIVPNLHDAYRRPEFMQARYATLMTGPSATADIEGVLVRGAQGIRSLMVVPSSLSRRLRRWPQHRRDSDHHQRDGGPILPVQHFAEP
jgi:L-lactate dehydrogenase complex protein LldG